jgi:sporulation protein YlmC with PRC-barrel domain
VELSGEGSALSALIGMPVVDSSGGRLGRVFEVRAHWTREGTIVFDELLLGRGALLRRLRGPGPARRAIPWGAIVEIGSRRMVARVGV